MVGWVRSFCRTGHGTVTIGRAAETGKENVVAMLKCLPGVAPPAYPWGMSDSTEPDPSESAEGRGIPSTASGSGTWARVEDLFRRAIELPPEERRAFLQPLEMAPSIRSQVLDLLEAHEAAEAGSDPLSGLARGLQSGRAASLLREVEAAGPRPGDEVGRYRILRRLGQGGMGTVYEAHDPVLDRSVALKFLPPLLDDGTRLLEEARAAGALDHPGIGTVHEVGRDAEGRSFFAMACYPGGTLRERLRSGPLPAKEAAGIAIQVAEALDAAHGRGILHRDVKPENLLFDERGRVKVVDFGIALATGAREHPGCSGGTPAYLSPERARGRPADARSDLWSLAIVLHEMLTGRRPSTAPDAPLDAPLDAPRDAPGDAAEMDGVMHATMDVALDPQMDPGVDPALAAVMRRALAPAPDDRFPTGAAMATALREAVQPPPEFTSMFSGARGRRIAAVAGALAILLFVAGAVVAWQGPRLVDARGFAGDAFSARGTVLVTEFASAEDLDDLARATREALVVDLQQSGFVRVLPRARVEETLGLMGHPIDRPVQGSLAREVAERAGAGAIVETSVARAGSRYILSGRVLASRTGEELFAVRTAAGERGLLGAVERLSREMRRRLGEATESLAESRPLPQVTTASLEALHLYALAERAMVSDPPLVPGYLDAALELDPGFAMAHRMAAAAGVNRMRFEDTNRHLRLAWEHRERLVDRERWLVEAARASEVEYRPFRAEELYERLVTRFPDDFLAWANLGNTRMSWLHDPEGALVAVLRAADVAPDDLRTLPGAAQVALALDRPEQADAIMARAGGPSFESMQARWRVTRAFWHRDRVELGAACTDLLAAGFSPLPQADDREVCGSMLLVEGDTAGGVRLLEEAIDDYARRGSFRNLASVFQSLAVADLLAGDTARARERFLEVVELAPPEAFGEPDRFIFRMNLEIHAAYLGWTDVVQRIQARYPPLADPEHLLGRGGVHLARAATAVASGDGEEALAALESAFPPGVMPMGWRTFDELLRGLAFELLGEDDLATIHLHRTMNRGWAGFPGLTKDRLNIIGAEEALARLEARDSSAVDDAP